MWNVDKIAAKAAEDGAALQVPAKGIGGGERDGFEIVGELSDLSYFFRGAEQEILVLVIELRERANDVARVSAHAELVDSANVERNAHD